MLSLPPKKISNSNWTKKKWNVLNGKKINGAGSGFFEYKFQIPENFKNLNFKEAYFIIEASAKKLFDKDKKGEDYVDAGMDWMRGSIVSPSKNPNSYPMTDQTFFPSKINISVNGKSKKRMTLSDDPADHRGVLSWHNQIISSREPSKQLIFDEEFWANQPKLNEAGSYGYLIKVPVSNEELISSINQGNLTVRIQTEGEGGIAIYGKSFGRYPINPSLVIKK